MGKHQDDRGVGCNRQTYQGQVGKQNTECPEANGYQPKANHMKLSLWGPEEQPCGARRNSLPALNLPCKVIARSRAGELDLAVQGGIAEEVAEVLKELQKLI